MNEFISIVIPLYNKASCILKTIQSVINQTYTNFELIVVNDGSTDEGVSIASSYPDSRIRVINKKNGGVCSARNRGIREAKGDYIAFIDADDLWEKDYLEEQVKMIHDFPEAAMWSINFAATRNEKICRRYKTGLPEGYRGYVKDYFLRADHESELSHPSCVLIRKDVFDKVGMWDERIRYSEDSDMWFRINAVYKTAFYDRIMVYYEQEAENRAMNRRRDMRYFLPYYVDKFKDPMFRGNKECYTYVNRWCAVRIKQYYFSNDELNRKEAKEAATRLDYSVIPFKYRLFFCLPYSIAKKLYKYDQKRMTKV